MRSALVTGASGFLGQHLVKRLLSDGWDRICCFSRGEHRQAELRAQVHDDPRCRWLIGDIRDLPRLERAMQGVQLVLHTAALKRIEVGYHDPDEMVKTNVLGSMNVVDAAARAGVEKVLLVSSDKAFQPVSPYGQAKALAESLFLTANNVYPDGPKFGVVRYGNIWNATGSVLPKWRSLIAAGAHSVPVTDPDATRFFMRIEEAVDLILGTAQSLQGGEIAIPTLPAYRVGDLAEALGTYMEIVGLPTWEKKHESMDESKCSATARRMSVEELKEALNHA